MSRLPIGVFDSGMGGLTVLNELVKRLPQESFIYLGDTARLPYGTKSKDTVLRYGEQMASLLVKQHIKMLVVACNTATAYALPHLQALYPDMPVLGVIEPGAMAAVAASDNIAVLATEATIASNIYPHTIQQLAPQTKVISQACGLFVALAEEGCVNDEVAYAVIRKYLQSLVEQDIHCFLLGCTHFPLLTQPIQEFVGQDSLVVSSAEATANYVTAKLQQLHLQGDNQRPVIHYLVTDLPERFLRIGPLFLEHAIKPQNVSLVDHHFNGKMQG